MKASPPSAGSHPHTFAWFVLILKFSDAVKATWGAAQAAPAKGGKAPAKAEPKKEEPKKETKAAADDDMDLFGDDGDDEVSRILNREAKF